ncbi:hypothetical protein ACQP00_40700 [Dactylosporangium sp. CS-047395]|uniref:hypothetical protein n=1 Tax=Dactylosporangium sp. CS-047395 TaxID=3239936 RepID=UPI003D93708B
MAIGMLIIGGIGFAGSAVLAVPAWRAAHGGGRAGTFTLTEAMSCDRNPPPRQRCGWFGDFTGDDGTVVRRHYELAEGLPPGSKVGDTVAARDTGSLTQIYRAGDTQAWKAPAGSLAAFASALVLGLLLLAPWSWRLRRQPRQADRV